MKYKQKCCVYYLLGQGGCFIGADFAFLPFIFLSPTWFLWPLFQAMSRPCQKLGWSGRKTEAWSLFSFFFLSLATSTAYGNSWARGQIGAIAASLHHSHSNTRSRTQPAHYTAAHGNARSPTHWARPGIELAFFFFFSFLFRAGPLAYGGSQARGWSRAVAAGSHHSHSNARYGLCLGPIPQLMATPDP